MQSVLSQKMNRLKCILSVLVPAICFAYDEDFARYKLWPMASATFGINPDLCVKDNFANATVRIVSKMMGLSSFDKLPSLVINSNWQTLVLDFQRYLIRIRLLSSR